MINKFMYRNSIEKSLISMLFKVALNAHNLRANKHFNKGSVKGNYEEYYTKEKRYNKRRVLWVEK